MYTDIHYLSCTQIEFRERFQLKHTSPCLAPTSITMFADYSSLTSFEKLAHSLAQALKAFHLQSSYGFIRLPIFGSGSVAIVQTILHFDDFSGSHWLVEVKLHTPSSSSTASPFSLPRIVGFDEPHQPHQYITVRIASRRIKRSQLATIKGALTDALVSCSCSMPAFVVSFDDDVVADTELYFSKPALAMKVYSRPTRSRSKSKSKSKPLMTVRRENHYIPVCSHFNLFNHFECVDYCASHVVSTVFRLVDLEIDHHGVGGGGTIGQLLQILSVDTSDLLDDFSAASLETKGRELFFTERESGVRARLFVSAFCSNPEGGEISGLVSYTRCLQ